MERDNMMHGARSALNTNSGMREWAESYLRQKSRTEKSKMNEEEFEHFWKYHKPEIIHAGSAEAVQAYKDQKNP